MRAVVISRYGGPEVLEYRELPAPRAGRNEAVVRVHASNVNPIDWKIRDGALKMFIRAPFPITLGVDLAGEVIEAGQDVKNVAVGDQVFAMMPKDIGAQAELVALDAELLVRKPQNMTMGEAASVPSSALTALQALRDLANLEPGQRVLINGASGGVGLFAVQLAKILGADVTAVCSADGFDLVTRLGADRVIDYRQTDFTTQPQKYHVVFDAVGKRSPRQCKKVIVKGGSYVSTAGTPQLFIRQGCNPLFSRKVFAIIVKSKGADLAYIKALIESGKLRTVIDKVYPVTEIAEAQTYSATGRAKGKLVLTFPESQRARPRQEGMTT